MLFNSLRFLVFFPVVYAAYRALGHRWQNRLLLLASYVFYASWDWRFLSLILFSTAVDYVCALRMGRSADPRARQRLLLVSLITNLGLLGTFKYFDFFSTSLVRLMGALGIAIDGVTLHVILPVGISFYTFQTLSYTIDVYRGRLEPESNFADFALFVAFFPQLVAGPIERAEHLLPQIRRKRNVTSEQISAGLWMVAWGFFLKMFMADNLATIVDDVFGRSGAVDGPTVLIAVYAFAFQIFGDFAGYSFIAKGIGSLMGIELSTNFLFPYLVTSPREFWRHWHITLSSWLRDYLYVPLGGNRGSRWRVQRNLLLTMLLGGLWHGAGWTFVLWGAYQGVALAVQRGCEPWERRIAAAGFLGGPAGHAVKVALMFHLTCLGWLIFRATSVAQAGDMLTSLLTRWQLPTESTLIQAQQLLLYTALPLVVHALQWRARDVTTWAAIPPVARVAAAVAMVYAMLVWGNYGGGEFIYFQF